MGSVVDGTPAALAIRRCIVQTFRAEIDYMLEADELVVVAIFHTSREPGLWLDRLRRK
jgi:hypothetical protein